MLSSILIEFLANLYTQHHLVETLEYMAIGNSIIFINIHNCMLFYFDNNGYC